MDAPRASSRSSRRSYPNLHNLSLAPLSSKYPLDASAPPSPSDGEAHTLRTSYIAQKSAPTTPGILSLSQSRSSSRNGRRRSSKGYVYDGYITNLDAPLRDTGDIPKAKSTNALLPGVSFADQPRERNHKRQGTAPVGLRLSHGRHHTSEQDSEWFHRAGLAIAGETRDSKGQGWLVRRESSSSLVDQTNGYEQHASHDARHMTLLSGEHLPDADFAPFTPRFSRAGSRINSRVGSRAASARNSRRGSRIDLIMSTGPKTPNARHSIELDEDIFEQGLVEPDFVEGDEGGDDDEEEVARLARDRGFGLGSWMDQLIGWTLFSVDEDAEDSDDDEDIEEDNTARPANMTREELKLRREVEAKRRKLEREAIIAASAVHSGGIKDKDKDKDRPDREGGASQPRDQDDIDGGGWQDAAWLLA